MPDDCGSTRLRTSCVAIAASMAEPPARRISRPACAGVRIGGGDHVVLGGGERLCLQARRHLWRAARILGRAVRGEGRREADCQRERARTHRQPARQARRQRGGFGFGHMRPAYRVRLWRDGALYRRRSRQSRAKWAGAACHRGTLTRKTVLMLAASPMRFLRAWLLAPSMKIPRLGDDARIPRMRETRVARIPGPARMAVVQA